MRNMQYLTTEIYKVKMIFLPKLINEVIVLNKVESLSKWMS